LLPNLKSNNGIPCGFLPNLKGISVIPAGCSPTWRRPGAACWPLCAVPGASRPSEPADGRSPRAV